MKNFLWPVFFFLSIIYTGASARFHDDQPFIVVLGTAQDGGYPHAGCNRQCCLRYYEGKEKKHFISCIAVVDPVSGERFIFDCTPDFPAQLRLLDSLYPSTKVLDGIFLTHAHIGHYAGLMYLGRESMNTNSVPVFAMPDMKEFLEHNGPWSLLVALQNVKLMKLAPDSAIKLNHRISVTPFYVPHRHEFTKAVGYKIFIPGKSIIFIPDIDKWENWEGDIVKLIKDNDLLFLDGTFYDHGEIPGRDISQIPHPFMVESMNLFKSLPLKERSRVYFIHLNHSNPTILGGSTARQQIEKNGYHVAMEGAIF
ncbi:MAG: MBL fold metallo-hydrolase [Chitinophagales bacterium]